MRNNQHLIVCIIFKFLNDWYGEEKEASRQEMHSELIDMHCDSDFLFELIDFI